MKNLLNTPFSLVKKIHFIGIGGMGMSGLAELFRDLGYEVQGSDLKETSTIRRLIGSGIKIYLKQEAKNITEADIVVLSSAIKEDNAEYKAAINLGIPMFKRAKMLAELMRFKWSIAVAGTHGKTTTTSLISHVLQHAKLDPTAVIGGVVNSWGQNSRFGQSNWLVAESDESDGSFVDLPATISVVTNIDAEHLDFYGNYDKLKSNFVRFINNIPFMGFSVLCVDNEGIRDILPLVKQRRIITYGVSPQADYRVININYNHKGTHFDVECQLKARKKLIKGFFLPMYGHHNVLNAVSAYAVADNIGVDPNVIREALATFKGVKRRFTNIGTIGGVTFIDDYAHHPAEIAAAIDAANQIVEDNAIVSVIQPHRYTRLRDHFDGFCKCVHESEYVLIIDVYKAGETPIAGYDAETLVQGIKDRGHKNVYYVPTRQLEEKIKEIQSQSIVDMVLFMGAGDISIVAQKVYDNLK